MIKCIYCDEEAEYIFCGQSVCKDHCENISLWDVPSEGEFKKSPLWKYLENKYNKLKGKKK